MNNNAASHANAPQPLLSTPLRIAAVVVIASVMGLVVMTAKHESHQAVQNAAVMLSPDTVHLTLPSVEVVGRRERASAIRGGAAG